MSVLLALSSPGAVAFQLGPIVIRWYGILMAASIVLGLWLGHRRARLDGLPADDIISAGQWAVLAGLVGARLYEVAFNWDYYGRNPAKIVAVWEGGLAIHGGLIAGPLVGAWLAWRWRLPVLRGLDVAASPIALAQAIAGYRVGQVLGWIGQRSMPIYVLHILPMSAARIILHRVAPDLNLDLRILIVSTSGLVFSLIGYALAARLNLLTLTGLGKDKSRIAVAS